MSTLDLHSHRMVRLQTLCDSVQMAIFHAVEGDIGEFGIASGSSLHVMAQTLAQSDVESDGLRMPRKRLHAFDSFEGLPQAHAPEDTASPLVKSGVWAPGTCPSPGFQVINEMLGKCLPPERFALYPGWFSDTLPTLAPEVKFALVHLDCDFYESSMQVLIDLFEKNRFADGCLLLCDDFLCNRGSKKFGQRRAWEECVARYKPDITDLGYYGIESWRCLIHAA